MGTSRAGGVPLEPTDTSGMSPPAPGGGGPSLRLPYVPARALEEARPWTRRRPFRFSCQGTQGGTPDSGMPPQSNRLYQKRSIALKTVSLVLFRTVGQAACPERRAARPQGRTLRPHGALHQPAGPAFHLCGRELRPKGGGLRPWGRTGRPGGPAARPAGQRAGPGSLTIDGHVPSAALGRGVPRSADVVGSRPGWTSAETRIETFGQDSA